MAASRNNSVLPAFDAVTKYQLRFVCLDELWHIQSNIINPRRACAARVTVVGLCVRPSVRPSVNR